MSGREVHIWVDIIPAAHVFKWDSVADRGTPVSAKALIESFIGQSDSYSVKDMLDDLDLLDGLDFAIRVEVSGEEGFKHDGTPLHSTATWEGTEVTDDSSPRALIHQEASSD